MEGLPQKIFYLLQDLHLSCGQSELGFYYFCRFERIKKFSLETKSSCFVHSTTNIRVTVCIGSMVDIKHPLYCQTERK